MWRLWPAEAGRYQTCSAFGQENQAAPREGLALPPIAESRPAKGKAVLAERQQSCLDGLWGLLSQAVVLHASCPAALAQALQLLLAMCEVRGTLPAVSCLQLLCEMSWQGLLDGRATCICNGC